MGATFNLLLYRKRKEERKKNKKKKKRKRKQKKKKVANCINTNNIRRGNLVIGYLIGSAYKYLRYNSFFPILGAVTTST